MGGVAVSIGDSFPIRSMFLKDDPGKNEEEGLIAEMVKKDEAVGNAEAALSGGRERRAC